LNHIASKGLNAIESTDPFYFSPNAKQLRISSQSIFILETGFIKVMNEESGIIRRQFPVAVLSFKIIKKNIVLLDGLSNIVIYDKSGMKKKEIELPEEFERCDLRFLSNYSLIEFYNCTSQILISELF